MLVSSVVATALLALVQHGAALQGPAFHYPDCTKEPLKSNLVCDTSASPAARAKAVIAAMNITEKLQNLVDHSNGSARLGLPAYEWWQEALHGIAVSPGVNFSANGEFSYATSFPTPILFSGAFDDQLVQDIAGVISTEARAYSNAMRVGLDFFTPNINPYKDPRWGRGAETPGEDPFRIQNYVRNLLIGLEGGVNPPLKKMIATCKHFAGYDMEQWDGIVRYGFDARIKIQELVEYYLPPFQQCARDSHVGSIMCSYNAVNGVPSCANSYLMQTVLREHWGWETTSNPYITSDCNAVQNIYANHEYVVTAAEAAGVAYPAGTDNACEAGYPTNVTGAYETGLLTEAVIDKALMRQYEALVIAGYFDPASTNPYRSIGWDQVNTPYAQQLARQAATEGIVLLKNDGTLPLNLVKGDKRKIALIGFWANATTSIQGAYSGIAPYIHNPVYAAQQLDLNYVYADGPINETAATGNWTAPALAAAKEADIVMYFGGIDNSVAAEALDRYSIAWSESQLALIKSISSLGKPTVVLQLGDQLDNTPILNNKDISAIIWAGYPSQDGGTAVFDIVTGKVAPAGRLPVTQYPANYVNEVALTNMNLRPGTDNPGRTYKWYDKAVQPFGYGLHYTKFAATFTKTKASAPSYGSVSIAAGGSYNIQEALSACTETHKDLCNLGTVSVSVANNGKVESDFVALAFVNTTAGPKPAPLKTLAAYARLFAICEGETRTVDLNVTLGVLARREGNGDLTLYPGTYNMLLDVPTQHVISFSLTGKAAQLEAWPQPPANQTYKTTIDCPEQGACGDEPILTRRKAELAYE